MMDDPFDRLVISPAYEIDFDKIMFSSFAISKKKTAAYAWGCLQKLGRAKAKAYLESQGVHADDYFAAMDEITSELKAIQVPTRSELFARYQDNLVEQLWGRVSLRSSWSRDSAQHEWSVVNLLRRRDRTIRR